LLRIAQGGRRVGMHAGKCKGEWNLRHASTSATDLRGHQFRRGKHPVTMRT